MKTRVAFFKRLAMLLKDNPPYPADSTMVERLKRLGVEAGKDFDPSKLDPAIRKGMNEAPFEVWKKFVSGPFDKGWTLDSGHKYVLHITKADTAASQNGVWSISQYRENFYVHNPI
jgi:hypothetical protein